MENLKTFWISFKIFSGSKELENVSNMHFPEKKADFINSGELGQYVISLYQKKYPAKKLGIEIIGFTESE